MIFQRLKNLWKLSEFEPMKPQDNGNLETGTIVSPIIKRPKMAEIIRKKSDPVDEIVNS